MPKSIVLGNGNILICFDESGRVSDFYFPFVGLENHIGVDSYNNIGVWVDSQFSWLNDITWKVKIDCEDESLASNISAVNDSLGIELRFNDIVYNEMNIFIRSIEVRNLKDKKREVKIYFHHQFLLYSSHQGDTAFYDPKNNVIVHYKGRRNFLINAMIGDKVFDDYSIGIFGIEGKEGTHKDAEDGKLSKNPVEHGRVDSVIGLACQVNAKQSERVYYWMVVDKHLENVYKMNDFVLGRHPQSLIQTTKDFWKAWVNRQNFNYFGLDDQVVELFKKSLFYIRSHTDNRGAIIASGDSNKKQHGRDSYAFMWPRDGAMSAMALDKAGDRSVAKKFFEFCNDVISEDGYFLHKFRPDKALGSSWHPWIRNNKPELPIQEDATALVLYALWEHYKGGRDLEFVEQIYNSLIKKAADFMVGFTYKDTGLSHPSYDIWEEKFGISTFTCAAKYGALISASKFAKLLGKVESEKIYIEAAESVKKAIQKYLYKEPGLFLKTIIVKGKELIPDKTLDISSVYGIYKFGVLPHDDSRLKKAIKLVENRLSVKTDIGGVCRYEGDVYYKVDVDGPSNPWFITTLWLAQYYISIAKKEKDLGKVRELLKWVAKYASPSGILSEQINPYTGEQLSVAPLTWSHSEFVTTVTSYLEKLEELGICISCYPIK
jgi:GH15 family glucan-1,4-alpha-glucosidase